MFVLNLLQSSTAKKRLSDGSAFTNKHLLEQGRMQGSKQSGVRPFWLHLVTALLAQNNYKYVYDLK